jgi:hypothetical protein
VVDVAQSGIAFLLLCLNLLDVLRKNPSPLIKDLTVLTGATKTYVCPLEHEVAINHQSCGLTLGPGLPDEYRAAIRKGGRVVGAGAREIRWSGLVVRVTKHSPLSSRAARLNTLLAPSMRSETIAAAHGGVSR